MFKYKVPTFNEHINENDKHFQGEYDNGANGTKAYPIERLRNKLNGMLGLVDLLKDDGDPMPIVDELRKINIKDIYKYLNDEELITSKDDLRKYFGVEV